MSEFKRVASIDEIPTGTMKGFTIGPDKIVIANTADGVFAALDECSHAAVPLSRGRLEGSKIECKAHGAKFDMKTGAVTAPPAVAPLDLLELEIRGNDIYIKLD